MYWWNILWGNYKEGNGYIGMAPFGESETKFQYKDNLILIDPNDCEIMQFTGKKDKNGKEIYEGDILKADKWSFNWIVQFDKLKARFNCIINKEGSNNDFIPENHVEIIGNIYENENLLK